jgi:hypothetical protein
MCVYQLPVIKQSSPDQDRVGDANAQIDVAALLMRSVVHGRPLSR